jgi:pyruvate carboxylase
VFTKVLVANRGEIAIRAFRAAYELGIGTVAVYPVEDRNSVHRTKADESYQIGEPGHPVRAYLSVPAIIGAARAAGADAIYPGYGFLSENPDLAAACARAGITFVGPSAQVLELTGNKARAIAAAKAAGLPVLASSEPSTDIESLMAAAESMTFPVFVKAVAGGGGRGMRRVGEFSGLRDAIEAAAREAESAFGDATVFLEQAVIEPRHIEVQILADTGGNVIHLFERDCSVQRRHQKVVELAPAPNISPDLRSRLCADAVAFARQIGYSCAGTVEFLVDTHGNHVFIEMNPRIQVEHTVTEEITDVDLVQAQLRVAAGETLAEMGLAQDTIAIRGAALQCRITTEDPANGSHHRLPHRRGGGYPVGRGHRVGRRGVGVLRFDAGEADLPWPHVRGGGRPGPTCGRGVPDPWCGHQPAVSASGSGRPGLPGRSRDDIIHRATPAPADGAPLRGPRHQDFDLSR